MAFPFSDTCDLLADDTPSGKALFASLTDHCLKTGASRVELRLASSVDLIPEGENRADYVLHRIPLDKEPSDLFSSFHKNSTQRAIKKAEKSDLTIVAGKNETDLKAFYKLHLMTRKKHGVPIQPFTFFKHLWDVFYPKNMLSLLLGEHNGEPIAGMIILWMGRGGYYKFGASNSAYQHLRVNQLLMWRCIQEAYQRNCRFFDLGRSSIANKGLIEYKNHWSAAQMPLYYVRWPDDKHSNLTNEASRLHRIANRIINRSPDILIRIAGRLFYKYFA